MPDSGILDLGYSILYSTLVLYMRGKLGMSVTDANSIMGVFIAFNFGLHLLGGYLGGRFASWRVIYCAGMVAQVVGGFLLSLETEYSFYYGLAAFLTGCGLNVTCLYCMLTQLFEADDERRQAAFLWMYASMNAGFFAGYIMSGYFQLIQNYQVLFGLGALGNVLALLLCLKVWNKLDDKGTTYSQQPPKIQKRNTMAGLLVVLLLPFFLVKMVQHAEWAKQLVLCMGFIMLTMTLILAFRQKTPLQRNKLLAFTALAVVSLIFWTLYQLAPMGLMFFIDNNVQRNMGFFTIPPQWFQSVNTICILAGGPLLSMIFLKMQAAGYKNRIPIKFAFALFLIGLAFVILPWGISRADANGFVNPGWIIFSFILQSIGELLISPVGYAMIGALAPVNLQGILMGIWMLCHGIGATLASYSSNWINAEHESLLPQITNSDYSHCFLLLGLSGLAGALLVYCLVPVLNRLMYPDVETMIPLKPVFHRRNRNDW